MKPKFPSQVDEILDLYIKNVNSLKPNLLEGFYLYGSIVSEDFSLELSDIDFIAITKERLSEAEIKMLHQVHRKVELKYKKPNLNGIYITWDDLGKLQSEIQPFPYFLEGKMYKSGYFELNLVTWYEFKNKGIKIMGPEISDLNIEVDFELLISRMHQNLNSYWSNWIIRSSKLLSLVSLALYFRRNDMEWGVLGITRLFYTFREHKITTKVGAGKYALEVVPVQWHKIIQECINTRSGMTKSLYQSRITRKSDAINYMKYIMKESNRIFEINM
ncbi:aminoglycoside adenylyltransferase domain-containing protein [Paenibacillus sp. KN14-4R]|uniref:aminoglycoside adenylyltransferase domain-containing protein n=1 Tax=Paenibacillus sp. KN14-4R TaxID=3445773 RepID=UPI003FA1784B